MVVLRILLLVLGVVSGNAFGQIYKRVDADGNVSYSSQPPKANEQAEEISIEPGPSAADVSAAAERLERLQRSNAELEKARKARAAEYAKQREAERQRRAEENARRPPPPEEPRYYAPYYPYWDWPAYRPRPPHPEHRPRPPVNP